MTRSTAMAVWTSQTHLNVTGSPRRQPAFDGNSRLARMYASIPSDRQIRKTLHAINLRGTPARVAIMRAVFRRGSPISQAEVSEALGELRVDLSTICRALNDMINVGLLRRVEVGDLVWRYELATDRRTISEHPHFYCTSAGESPACSILKKRSSPFARNWSTWELFTAWCCGVSVMCVAGRERIDDGDHP